MEYKLINLGDLKADPHQPRKFFDEADLRELTASIIEKGVIQPILVRPISQGKQPKYMVVCGERRFKASLEAAKLHKSIKTIPAIIRELTDAECLDLQIIENLQRKDVRPLEEASIFYQLRLHMTDEHIAAKIGKTARFVKQRIQLLDLTAQWQEILTAQKITLASAIVISSLPAEKQSEAVAHIKNRYYN